MNSDSEITAHRLALDEVARFGRVLGQSEREEVAYLERLLQLEYRGDDLMLYALGETD